MATELILTGNVQGVFCRDYCSQNARKLGIKGSASNLRDGSVRVLLDTENEELVEKYISWLHNNPYGFRFYGSISNISRKKSQDKAGGDYIF